MSVSFSTSDLNRWAEYSGDWNPIHFDLGAAKLLNCDRLITHGMLVLMEVFKRFDRGAVTELKASSEWVSYKAAFRLPVQIDSAVDIQMVSKNKKLSFHVTDHCKDFIKGHQSFRMPEIFEAEPMFRFDVDTVLDDLHYFTNAFPEYGEMWHWLNAFTFSVFIKHLISDLVSLMNLPAGGGEAVSVQTTHQIFVHPNWAKMTVFERDQIDDLSVKIKVLPSMEEETKVAGEICLSVECKQETIFIQEIGVLTSRL